MNQRTITYVLLGYVDAVCVNDKQEAGSLLFSCQPTGANIVQSADASVRYDICDKLLWQSFIAIAKFQLC